MNTRQTGNVYEQIAADYLEKQGMRILERNFRRGRNGEIAKQKMICEVADYYRILHKYDENTWVRYDVVAIQGEQIIWVPNAFLHHYRTRR